MLLQSTLVEVIPSNIMPVRSSRHTADAAWNKDIWRKGASTESSKQQDYLRDLEMEGSRLQQDSNRESPPTASEGKVVTTRNISLHMPELVYKKPKSREPKKSELISFANDKINFPSSSLKPREQSLGTQLDMPQRLHPLEKNGSHLSSPIFRKAYVEPILPASAPLSPPILKNIARLTPNKKLIHSDRNDNFQQTPQPQRMAPYYHQPQQRGQLANMQAQSSMSPTKRSGQGHYYPSTNRSSWTAVNSSSRTSCCTPNSRPLLHSPSSVMSLLSRPAPEVLKTLLRKKACLYEPVTSRAITLTTWLIGRDLALRKGYFTRQDLQTGVHAVVSNKIDSGFVTRTKVNRCMQIILNSCFHYIIPKPDGSVESGDTFREDFTKSVVDDTYLLHSLLPPWQDLDVSLAAILEKNEHFSSQEETEHEVEGSPKRLVLLCFNENVRSAKDVYRCHNEFIRDAAISANLHLSAEEWNVFYSKRDDDVSQGTPITSDSTKSEAVISSPLVSRDGEGADGSFFTFDIPPEVSQTLSCKENNPTCVGMFGAMNTQELAEFRTTWCCKRYDHDIEKCKFAHVDINLGWLRRDATKYDYKPVLCPHVSSVPVMDRNQNECVYVNACKNGKNCKFAHSHEEVNYHPLRYKKKECKLSCCQLRDICPCVHNISPSMVKSPRIFRSPKGSRASGQGMPLERSAKSTLSNGAPMMYIKPSPESDCEKRLRLPGLRTLFRQNCGAHYAATLPGNTKLPYTCFGDTHQNSAAELK